MMRAMYVGLGVALVSLGLGGCATDVDDPVQQIPDPAPAQDPPAQALSGKLLAPIEDPAFSALKHDTAAEHAPALPARQLPNVGPKRGAADPE